MLFSKSWLAGAGERALKTFVQSLIAGFLASAPITDQPWLTSLGVAATATVLSIATSVLNADFTSGSGDADSADLLAATVDPEPSADEDGPQHLAADVPPVTAV